MKVPKNTLPSLKLLSHFKREVGQTIFKPVSPDDDSIQIIEESGSEMDPPTHSARIITSNDSSDSEDSIDESVESAQIGRAYLEDIQSVISRSKQILDKKLQEKDILFKKRNKLHKQIIRLNNKLLEVDNIIATARKFSSLK